MSAGEAGRHVVGFLDFIYICDITLDTPIQIRLSGYLLVNLIFLGLGKCPWKYNFVIRNEAQEQHGLLDTIFDYICFILDLQENIYNYPSVTLTRGLFATWVEPPGVIFLASYFRLQIPYFRFHFSCFILQISIYRFQNTTFFVVICHVA